MTQGGAQTRDLVNDLPCSNQPEEQFGFMPNTGTADVGIAIADQIATTLEARDELRVVALDFRGAFDRVWW